MLRQRSRTAPASQSSSGRAPGGQQQPAQQQRSGGLFGWAKRAGDWMGEQVNSATETVGGWIDDGVRVARDVVDVVQSTSVGFEDGALAIRADADELMDLLPARLKQQFQFDRAGADNQFRIDIDRKNGRIVFRADELALHGVDLPQLGAGRTVAKDVEIILNDRDGKLSLSGLTDINEYDLRVRVGGLDVTDLAMKDGLGRATTEVESTTITGLTLDASRDEQGRVAAELAIDQADARGLTGDTAAKSLSVTGLRAGVDEAGESASIDVDKVVADQLHSESGAGSGSARGLSVRVDNAGGGLPFLDEKADAIRARVDVTEAEVSGLDTEKLDAGFLSVAAASFDVNAVDKSVDGSFDRFNARDVSGPLGLGSAEVTNGRVSANTEKVSVGADEVYASKVDLRSELAPKEGEAKAGPLLDLQLGKATVDELTVKDGVTVGGVRGDDLSVKAGGQQGAHVQASKLGVSDVRAGDTRLGAADVKMLDLRTNQGGDVAVGFGEASAKDVRSGDVRVDSASAIDGSVTKQGDAVQANLAKLDVRGARQGELAVAKLSAADLALAGNLADKSGSASTSGLQASGLRQGDISVASLSTGAARGGVDAHGAVNAEAARLRIAGAAKGEDRVATADLTGARFAQADGRSQLSVDKASATGIAAAGTQVGRVDANKLDARWSDDAVVASVASAKAADVRTAQGAADAVSINQLAVDANLAKQTVNAQLGAASATGVRSAHGSADAVSLTQLGVEADLAKKTVAAQLGTASAQGVRSQHGSADAVALDKLAVNADLGKQTVDAQLAKAQVDGGRTAQGGADKLVLTDLAANANLAKGTGSGTLGAVNATGVNAQGVTAKELGASGVGVQVAGPGALAVSADALRGRDIRDGQSTRIGAVDAHDLDVRKQGGATQVGLGGLSATDITHKAAVGGGQGGSAVDMASLIRTGAQRVDDADLRVSASMNAGRYGSGLAGMKIAEGTNLDARVQIQDGRFAQGTGAQLSKPVDTAAWTSVRGAYMDDGALKADIRGFFDINASKHLNEAVGVRGDDLASVAAYGQAIAAKQGQPSSGADAAGPSPIDLATLAVNGQVGLSSGRIDAGAAQVDLDSRQAGANTVTIRSGNGQTQVGVDKLVAAVVQVSEGGIRGNLSGVEVDAARVALDQNGGDVQATIAAIRVGRIDLSSGR